MTPESLSSFEHMLASFAYHPPAGTAAGSASTVAARTAKGQRRKTKEEPKTNRGSPAPPQTPPRRQRRGDGPVVGRGTDAESAAMMQRGTTAAEAVASTFATVKDQRLEKQCPKVVNPAGPGTPLILPPDKDRHVKKKKSGRSVSSNLGTRVGGKPAIVSRFFHRQVSTTTGGREEKAAEARGEEQIELVEKVDENKPSPIDAAHKGKKRMKRPCGGTLWSPEENKLEGREDRKPKKKKVVVVSPYFAISSKRRVLEGGAGVWDEVVVVVQRSARKKRNNQPAESTAETRILTSRCRGHPDPVDSKKKRKHKQQSVQLTATERMSDAYKRVPDDCKWVPPFSDHELLQEFHHFDHWRVLVICMLLNRTTGREVRKVLPRLFLLCPDAEMTTKVSEEEIEQIIRPLGLQKKRSKMIKQMSEEYLQHEWTHVTQLHGIGKYAADAYAIFCSGMWMEVKPNDHKLVDYWRFLVHDKDARESIKWQKSS